MKKLSLALASLVLIPACGQSTKTKEVRVQDPEQTSLIQLAEKKDEVNQIAIAEKDAEIVATEKKYEALKSSSISNAEHDRLLAAAIRSATAKLSSDELVKAKIRDAVTAALATRPTDLQIEGRVTAAVNEATKDLFTKGEVDELVKKALDGRPTDEQIATKVSEAVLIATKDLFTAADVDAAVAKALANNSNSTDIEKIVADAVAKATNGLVSVADVEKKIKEATDRVKLKTAEELVFGSRKAAADSFAKYLNGAKGLSAFEKKTYAMNYLATVDTKNPCHIKVDKSYSGLSIKYSYLLEIDETFIADYIESSDVIDTGVLDLGPLKLSNLKLIIEDGESSIKFDSLINGVKGDGMTQGPIFSFSLSDMNKVRTLQEKANILIHECSKN